ncbi:NAD(P)/FAD-dependent oxidoreductase [Nioella nitratireducens]|uniref:NAD(P)/FAD-dependent oxidoreductase n=1 Tax=Nioella nitratireducens TaxID=1287720 RepID=UPI0008FD259C|nr:FAD-binding oxidoreductase [Nioella nitratireducens]
MTAFPLGLHRPVEHAAPLPAHADVVVIGGGVIGVMTAYYMAVAGLRPVLLEKGRVAAEQSSRNWGWVRQQGRDPGELPIMMEANRLWARLAAEVGEDLGLVQCGLTYLAKTEAEMTGFQGWLDEVAGSGVDSRLMSAGEVKAMLPDGQTAWAGALHTASDMRAEPWIAVPALARAAVRKGAVIVENCAARTLDLQGGAVAGVMTEQGHISASRVVVAGGAWSSLFLRRHGVSIPQLSVKATVVATKALPEIHAGGADGDGLAFRRRKDGGYSLAAGGFHEFYIGPDAFRAFARFLPQLWRDPWGRRYSPLSPKHYPDAWGTARRWSETDESPFEKMRVLNPAPNRPKVAELLARFAREYPVLGAVEEGQSWAGMIDTMPDDVPVVDEIAAIPGLAVCTGMCGHGFGIGPGFGRVMASLVAGDDPGHDLTRFRLGRFTDGSKLVLGPEI